MTMYTSTVPLTLSPAPYPKGANGEVKQFHISDLPEADQLRIMGYKVSKPVKGWHVDTLAPNKTESNRRKKERR